MSGTQEDDIKNAFDLCSQDKVDELKEIVPFRVSVNKIVFFYFNN